MGTDIRINGNRSGASCRPGERIATEHAGCNAIASGPATAYVRLVPGQVVTVFGGTGFLGRRIVRHLYDSGFAVRIAMRHSDRAPPPASDDGSILSLHADVNDDSSVASAVSGAWAVVNAVSLHVERGKDTFRSVHVRAAERVA